MSAIPTERVVLFLVRHGEASSMGGGRFGGWSDAAPIDLARWRRERRQGVALDGTVG